MSRAIPESARRRLYHARAGKALNHSASLAVETRPRLVRAVPPTRATSGSQRLADPKSITTARTESAVAVMDLPLPQQTAVASRPRILVVEDDPRVADVIRETLALEGDAHWTVEFASEGSRALALAYAAPPSVVLLDVRLPDLDGAEVYRRLRAEARTTNAHILFLTAGTSFDLHQRGIEDGVLLRKPFDLDTLVSLVRALVED